MKKNIKKHNSLTDAKTGKLTLRGDKMINALYLLFKRDGENLKIPITDLKDLLELKGGNYGEDIKSRLKELRDYSIEFRNVKLPNGEYNYYVDSFIQSFGIEKESINICQIQISSNFVKAFKEKMGYTPLDLEICNQFKTKYGLKLYEMYMRYYSLPNREGKGVGKISKTLDELNSMFGTKYKHPSKFLNKKDTTKSLAPINRGLNEIEKITGELISCFYHKAEKKFIFGWYQKEKYPNLRIPYERVDEFIEWYLMNKKEELKIHSILKYRVGLKKKILEDNFDDLDTFYRGMLKWKYDLNPNEFFDVKSGVYMDF